MVMAALCLALMSGQSRISWQFFPRMWKSWQISVLFSLVKLDRFLGPVCAAKPFVVSSGRLTLYTDMHTQGIRDVISGPPVGVQVDSTNSLVEI